MFSRIIAIASLMAAVASTSFAATPEVVGSYTGSAKVNSYGSDGSKSKTKADMQLDIAADDSTTLTLSGPAVVGFAYINGPVGFCMYSGIDGFRVVTFQIKNGAMKGVTQTIIGPGPETAVVSDGKFKLKKSE